MLPASSRVRRLSAACRSAPATRRRLHDCEPSGSICASAQFRAWCPVESAGRRLTDNAPSGSATLVPEAINAPTGRSRLPDCVIATGSFAPLGQVRRASVTATGRRAPASSCAPAGSANPPVPTIRPAGSSTLPSAARTSAASTVPKGSISSRSSVIAPGSTVPAGSVTSFTVIA